jgi:hypothetical protein
MIAGDLRFEPGTYADMLDTRFGGYVSDKPIKCGRQRSISELPLPYGLPVAGFNMSAWSLVVPVSVTQGRCGVV